MRILVTGAAGYIGSLLVPALLNARYEVVALDNFMYGQLSLLEHCHNPDLTVVRGDARDRNTMSHQMRGADFIIPLACIVGAPACDKDFHTAKSTNLEAIQLILELRKPKQKIIFPNTNSGYGTGQGNIYCDEHTPLQPISLYGKLKTQAEEEILANGHAITLRLATVFGVSPRMRLDLLVNDFVYRALSDKAVVLFEAHFKRNYIHVRDVCRAFLHCMAKFDQMQGQPYNVGLSNANLSKFKLCQEIQKQVPNFYFHEAPIGEDPDKRNYIVDNSRIEATGFKPVVSLQSGIAELIKSYQIVRKNTFTNL